MSLTLIINSPSEKKNVHNFVGCILTFIHPPTEKKMVVMEISRATKIK